MKLNDKVQLFKDIIKKRKNVNYIVSAISIVVCILTMSIAQNHESYIASAIITGSLIILISFCSVQSFELDTYVSVFLGYLISFSMICIVPLDAALNTQQKNQNYNINNSNSQSDKFKIYWIIMYWIIFFMGNFFYTLQQFFHNNGFIGFTKKLKSAFREFFKVAALGIALFIVLSIICLYWFKISGFNNILAVAVVISNVYGISILAFLFGYGLVKVPFYLWNKSEREDNLVELLCKTYELFKEYQASYWKFYDICQISEQFQRKIVNLSELSQYLELLKNETPNPLEQKGYRFKKNILYKSDDIVQQCLVKLRSNGKIDEDILATIRHEIKTRKFMYERQIQKWKRISDSVFSLITEESMNEIDRKLSCYSSRASHGSNNGTPQSNEIDMTKAKPVKVQAKEMHLLVNIGYKLLAIIFGLFSILIIFCEATLVFGSPNKALAFYQMIKDLINIPGIIILILLVLIYVIFCTYFALGKLKVFGSFELFPYFTHRDILIQNASTCLFLTFPLLYNVMLLFGIIDKDSKNDGTTYQSGFDKFYDPMKEIPFFGHYYNVIVCFLIVIIGIVSSFKKTQGLIKKFSKNKIKMNTEVDDDLMLKGELFILQEWQRLKDEQEVQEIQDSTEQDLPSEEQSKDQQQTDLQTQQDEKNKAGSNVENKSQEKVTIFRKVSNFFKRISISSSSKNLESEQKEFPSDAQQQENEQEIQQSSLVSIPLSDEESQQRNTMRLQTNFLSKK